MKFKKIILYITLAVLCFQLAACSGEKSNSGADTTLNKPAQDASSDYELIFVCPIVENPYWEACIKGIADADADLGTHTLVIGPATADNFATEIVDYIAQAVEAKPDGIMAYAGIDGMTPYIDKAAEDGIPFVSIDSDALTDSRLAYVGTNLYNLGYKAGERLVDITDGSARIAYICSYSDAQNERQVYDAFLDAIDDYDMEVAATAEGHNDEAYSMESTLRLLRADPGITAVFCTGGANVTGAARAVEALRRDVAVVGFEDTEENIEFVRSGIISALFVQSPENMGYLGVQVMKEYLDNGFLTSDTFDTDVILVTKDNVDSYISGSQDDALETVRIGYYEGSKAFQDGFSDDERKSGYAYEYYQAISTYAGWRYEYYYGSRSSILDLLRSGQVDIVAGIYRTDSYGANILFSDCDIDLEGQPRYFAVNAGRPDLLAELNSAMTQLSEDSPDFTVNLRNKYYGENKNRQILTDQDRAFLSEMGELRLGYVRYNLPLCDEDSGGNPVGLVKDLMEFISGYLGIPVVPVAYEYLEDLETALSNGEIDVAFPMYQDLWLSEVKGFRQTDSFISDRVMVVYSGSYSNDLLDRVALSRTGVGQKHYMSVNYPDSQLTFYDSREAAFNAIEHGDERCILGCSSILQRFMSEKTDYSDLHIAYLSTTEDFGMSVREEDSRLVSILNKALSNMGSTTISSAMMAYSGAEASYSIKEFIKTNALAFIAFLVLFLSILAFVFIKYLSKSRRFNREQAATNAALADALEAAKAASEAKTTFLSTMSHDIRTPMNAIVGMTAIASKHLDDTVRVEDCLDKIRLSSHHLLTLINDVLDISKIESGKLSLSPVNFSLRDTVSAIIDIVQPMASQKNIDFVCHVSGIVHETLFADEVRVNQIFINILSNAVKYTPSGGRVTMSLRQESLSENTVRITYVVDDTGIGMSQEFMSNMYETFSRAKDSRINNIQGTGLGLSIVKQMVDMMGGTIECESEENAGTRFTITLDMPIGSSGGGPMTLPPARVLIADDDQIFLDDTAGILRSFGLDVDTACGGREALAMCMDISRHGQAYSVVMAEWGMKGFDGAEVIEAINKLSKGHSTVLITGSCDWSDINPDDEKISRMRFMRKPFFPSYVYENLCHAFELQGDNSADSGSSGEGLAGMHVLVAEDNELNWEVLEELLDMYNISAERVENGRECVDKLISAGAGAFGAVLMDVQMPVMNGRDAARAIRADERAYVRDIPIIAMTADAFAEDIAACIQSGMDGHVAKPVDMDKFCQEMLRVLALRRKSGDA